MKLPVGYVNGATQKASAFGGLGQKLLEKQGWESGQGLGRERNGISKAIEVQKKEDQLGVGADLKPSCDWSKNFWAEAFDCAAAKITQNQADSDSSDDSSSDEEEPASKKKKVSEVAMNRDGTFASATAAELKLAAELAKDPWGRWGGRGGKMARIREQEASEARGKGEELGLPPSGRSGHTGSPSDSPSTSTPNKKKAKGDKGSSAADEPEAKKPKRIVIVVSIKDDQGLSKKSTFRFRPTPKDGWWGASYFMSAGAMEGMDDEKEDLVASHKGDSKGEGFKEADQEALYMRCHDLKRVGKRGLGKSTTLKIEGGNWEGSKKVFEDDAEPVKQKAKKGVKGVIRLAKGLLKEIPSHRMKICKLFKLLASSEPSLDDQSLKAARRSIKRGECEVLKYDLEKKLVSHLIAN